MSKAQGQQDFKRERVETVGRLSTPDVHGHKEEEAISVSTECDTVSVNEKTDGQLHQNNEEPKVSSDVGQKVCRSASDTSAARNPSDSLMNVAAYPTSDTRRYRQN